MITTIKYLILIRFRKILPKDDYLAISLFLIFYAFAVYFFNKIFLRYSYFFLFATLELFFYHQNRKDLDLLKLCKNYKFLLVVEYLIYSFPYLFIYAINHRFDIFLIHFSIVTILILIPKRNFKIIKYPFKLFDPFWHICFRKNKLIIFIPLVVFLNIVGDKYHNENLNISTLFIVTIIGCLPSFKREELVHLKASSFNSKEYLLKQIQGVVSNTILLSFILIVCFCILQKWDLLLFVPVTFLFPIISILFKYSFFLNPLLQQLLFAFFIGTMQIGLPFFILPFLYYKSIKTINELRYVRN